MSVDIQNSDSKEARELNNLIEELNNIRVEDLKNGQTVMFSRTNPNEQIRVGGTDVIDLKTHI